MGETQRIRFARGEERWLLMVSIAEPEESSEGTGQGTGQGTSPAMTWIGFRRQNNEQGASNVQGVLGSRDCVSVLPETSPDPAPRCRLTIGDPALPVGGGIEAIDAAVGINETAVVYLSGGKIEIATFGQFELVRGPVVVRDEATSSADPRVIVGAENGWLISWVDSDGQRVVAHYDARLRRTRRILTLTDDLAPDTTVAFDRATVNERPEYATAWVSQSDDGRLMTIAGLKLDGSRVRRSGLFSPLGAELSRGPLLSFDGERLIAALWASSDGLLFRAVGTDGLPDDHERQLEPAEPAWFDVVHTHGSHWIAWQSPSERTLWLRTDSVGCVDATRGFVQGRPEHLWATPSGAVVQVTSGVTRSLWRLRDELSTEGAGELNLTTAVPMGEANADYEWSHLEPLENDLTGVVLSQGSVYGALWSCEVP